MKQLLLFLIRSAERRFVAQAIVTLAIIAGVCQVQADETTNEAAKVSYAVGILFGSSLKRDGFEVDVDEVARGMRYSLPGTNALKDPDARDIVESYKKGLLIKAEQERMKEAQKNRKVAEAFLAANKTNEAVQTLASGLQYKVVASGDGAFLKTNDAVRVHSIGTFADGKEFENTRQVGVPKMILLGRDHVIKGLREGLSKMRVGDRWQLFLPPDLAYRDSGYMDRIPPGTALIYDIEILEVKALATPASASGASPGTNGPEKLK